MKLVYFLIFIFLFAFSANAQIVINEVMYDPISSDSYNEWIEIYNNGNGNVNLSGWSLCDKKILKGYINTSGYLFRNETFILKSSSYAVITDGRISTTGGTDAYKNFDVDNDSVALHVDVNSLCGGLGNTQGIIILKDENNIVKDSVSYYNYWNSNNEGKSIELVNPSLNNNLSLSWNASLNFNGTPGSKNSNFLKIIFGDVSGNGFVSAYDASLILRYGAGKMSLSRIQFLSGDVNLNGIVNNEDSSLILKYVVKKIKELPIL